MRPVCSLVCMHDICLYLPLSPSPPQVLQHFPFHAYRWHAVGVETVVPALEALLLSHG